MENLKRFIPAGALLLAGIVHHLALNPASAITFTNVLVNYNTCVSNEATSCTQQNMSALVSGNTVTGIGSLTVKSGGNQAVGGRADVDILKDTTYSFNNFIQNGTEFFFFRDVSTGDPDGNPATPPSPYVNNDHNFFGFTLTSGSLESGIFTADSRFCWAGPNPGSGNNSCGNASGPTPSVEYSGNNNFIIPSPFTAAMLLPLASLKFFRRRYTKAHTRILNH